jgi:hypothetical protein
MRLSLSLSLLGNQNMSSLFKLLPYPVISLYFLFKFFMIIDSIVLWFAAL